MKPIIRKILIFLIIFALVSIGVTYLAVTRFKKSNIDVETSKRGDNKEKKGIDLYGTYDENDLLIEEFIETYNEKEIKIPRINGLKNIEVQNKINKDIYERVYAIINKMPEIEATNIYISANFANIISIDYTAYEKDYETRYQVCLNYELINGTRLKFEDIFAKDANILQIVSREIYSGLAKSKLYELECEEFDYDYSKIILSPDENEVYESVNNFMNQKNKEFTLTASNLTFIYKNNYFGIRLIDIPDDVVIYNKYLTKESIYIKNDIGFKNIFTCADGNYSDYFEKIEYGYLEDNFWYDITSWESSYVEDNIKKEKIEAYKKFKEKIYSEAYSIIDEYRKKAKENPDKFYIVLSKPNVAEYSDQKFVNSNWEYTHSDMATVGINDEIYEMPREIYEKVYKDKIIEAYRNEYFYMHCGAVLYAESGDGAIYTNVSEEKLYNYMTGVELTKLSDVFYEDSDYMNTINKIVVSALINEYNYSKSESEKLLKTAEYKLNGGHVEVRIPAVKDFLNQIYLSEFSESSVFKLIEQK